MPELSDLAALHRLDPEALRRRIVEAVVASGGRRDRAAERLSVSVRTLYRYIRSLGLSADIERAEREAGIEPRYAGPGRSPA